MTYEDLVYSKEEGIATVTLHRPEKLNACSRGMRRSVAKAVEDAAEGRLAFLEKREPVFKGG